MADTKISALTDGSPAVSTDELAAARGASNVKITAGDVAALAAGGITKVRLSGRYYLTVGESNADATATLTLDQVLYNPFPVETAITIDRLSLGVSAAGGAGSVVRLGIYSTNASGYPGSLVLDAGTIDGTSATYQEIIVSQALSANTLYWFASVWQVGTAGTVRSCGTGNGSQWLSLAANSNDPRICAYRQTGVTGALPATATPDTTTGLTLSIAGKYRVA